MGDGVSFLYSTVERMHGEGQVGGRVGGHDTVVNFHYITIHMIMTNLGVTLRHSSQSFGMDEA